VIAQRERGHDLAGWKKRLGKLLPLGGDLLDVFYDEFGELHGEIVDAHARGRPYATVQYAPALRADGSSTALENLQRAARLYGNTPQEFAEAIKSDQARVAKVVRDAGIKPE
jgi:hypothetical protein